LEGRQPFLQRKVFSLPNQPTFPKTGQAPPDTQEVIITLYPSRDARAEPLFVLFTERMAWKENSFLSKKKGFSFQIRLNVLRHYANSNIQPNFHLFGCPRPRGNDDSCEKLIYFQPKMNSLRDLRRKLYGSVRFTSIPLGRLLSDRYYQLYGCPRRRG
jgi:hypothetical protein